MNVGSNDNVTQLNQVNTTLNNALTRRTGEGKGSLGKEDFLKLLMAQATHQDPLKPMDSEGMMSQLTAMGSLEQMINMNKQLGQLNQVQTDISQATAYTFLDKDVTVKGTRLSVSHGSAPALQFSIPREAESVKVQIANKAGDPVRSLDLGAQGPGHHAVSWDGRDNDGDPVPDGVYDYSVAAKSADNETLPVELYMRGKVSGVRFENGRNFLKVNGEDVDSRGLMEIGNRSERTFGQRQPMPLREELQPLPPKPERRR
ncbi:MAG: flagellar hook assembly protein FlgD [SAR324 cluster bacterium]